jgi:hypothetical protein
MKGIEYELMLFVIVLVMALLIVLFFLSGALNINLPELSPV